MGSVAGAYTKEWERIQPREKRRLLPPLPEAKPTLLKSGSKELRKAKGEFKAMTAASAAIREIQRKKKAAIEAEKEQRLARRLLRKESKTTAEFEGA
jgi:hypothetical protein